eukprot:6122335-Amphidinium_carterae.1
MYIHAYVKISITDSEQLKFRRWNNIICNNFEMWSVSSMRCTFLMYGCTCPRSMEAQTYEPADRFSEPSAVQVVKTRKNRRSLELSMARSVISVFVQFEHVGAIVRFDASIRWWGPLT